MVEMYVCILNYVRTSALINLLMKHPEKEFRIGDLKVNLFGPFTQRDLRALPLQAVAPQWKKV